MFRDLAMWLPAVLLSVCVAVGGSAVARAQGGEWQAVLDEARGQTVYFNGWGGSDRVNDYVAWAAERVLNEYGVRVRHVRVNDIAEVVARILAEKTAGRTERGSVDLMWINGENFAAMKENGLLGAPFVDRLPNFALVDTEARPTTIIDFSVPTDGLEAPWGMAQVVFMYDTALLDEPPRSITGLLAWARDDPGRFTYPQPPDFLGTTFLKQALVVLTGDRDALYRPVDQADFAAVTEPLWDYLDALHPHLWRGGETFPQAGPQLLQLLDDAEIDIAFNFNPNEASAAIADGLLPETVRTYVLDGGTIGNTHFVAIPFNAQARAGAMVFADFLLSPEAQARKADPRIWGDPTVLAMDRLSPEERALFAALPRGPATLPPEALGTPLLEPHASWTGALEAEWLARYGQ
ncbi:MAG: ABC transporter substrate-binding protein [Alphaproteobacteria bacterium]|jgi:putative thiamine transport system substrate-binding protein|nr:ABC transporter substrate-binding protein [Alphaproteobacteria bacterium]